MNEKIKIYLKRTQQEKSRSKIKVIQEYKKFKKKPVIKKLIEWKGREKKLIKII